MRHLMSAISMAAAVAVFMSQHALSDGVPYDGVRTSVLSYNWSGFYAGAHLGGTWGTTTAEDLLGYNAIGDTWDADTSGFVAGVQAGYNWQWGALLFGIEGDVGDLDVHGKGTTTFAPVGFDTSSQAEAGFYLTMRGRLGFVADHWLLYGTGGYIGADTRVSVLDACNVTPPCGRSTIDARDQSFRSGWTAGGGIETF